MTARTLSDVSEFDNLPTVRPHHANVGETTTDEPSTLSGVCVLFVALYCWVRVSITRCDMTARTLSQTSPTFLTSLTARLQYHSCMTRVLVKR